MNLQYNHHLSIRLCLPDSFLPGNTCEVIPLPGIETFTHRGTAPIPSPGTSDALGSYPAPGCPQVIPASILEGLQPLAPAVIEQTGVSQLQGGIGMSVLEQ